MEIPNIPKTETIKTPDYLLSHCHYVPEAGVDRGGSVAGGGLDVLRGGGGGALDALPGLPELGSGCLFLQSCSFCCRLFLGSDGSSCCFLLSDCSSSGGIFGCFYRLLPPGWSTRGPRSSQRSRCCKLSESHSSSHPKPPSRAFLYGIRALVIDSFYTLATLLFP